MTVLIERYLALKNRKSMELDIQLHSGDISPPIIELLLIADPNEESVHSYLHKAQILCTYYQNKLVGVAALILKSPGLIELMNICVAPDFQNQGFGGELLEACKCLGIEMGGKILEVGTGNSSIQQLAFYQKAGFRFHAIEPNYFLSYPEPIFENGIPCLDMIRLRFTLNQKLLN